MIMAFTSLMVLMAIIPREHLRQLTHLTIQGAKLPYGIIEDRPTFRHRGVLMDVCRHFFAVDEVKRQLDIMACINSMC